MKRTSFFATISSIRETVLYRGWARVDKLHTGVGRWIMITRAFAEV